MVSGSGLQGDARYLLATAALTVLLLYPVYKERGAYLGENARWMVESRNALTTEEEDVVALVETLQRAPPGRVYAGRGANWGKDYKIGEVPVYALLNAAGLDMVGYLYHALSLNADIQVLFDESRPEHYNLFNVRYVVAPAERTFPDFVRPVKDFGRHRLYQVATTGYFDLVASDVAFVGDKGDFYPAASHWLESDLPRLKQHPAVFFRGATGDYQQYFSLSQAGDVIPLASFPLEPPRGRVISEAVESNAYLAEVEVEQQGMLMLKATYHPNWHAYVDGVEADTVMLMPSYVGVKVAPGAHQVRLEYRPRPLRGHLLILGLLALPLIALAERRREELAGLIGRLNLARFRTRLAFGFRTQLGIYLLFLSIYLMSAAGHFFSTDHVAVYLTTQSLVENHTLAVKPINDTVIGPDGQAYSVFGVGQSLVSIPLYLMGRAVDGISPPSFKKYWGGVDLGDWGGRVPIFFVSLFNQFVTPLICVLVFLFCLELGFSSRASFLTTLIFGLGTAAWVYARDYFQHPLESLLLLLSIYILFRHRDHLQPRHALLSGISFAFGLLTRVNLIFVAPPILLYLFFITAKNERSDAASRPTLNFRARQIPRIIRRGFQQLLRKGISKDAFRYPLVFSLPVILVLALILYLNHVRFGHYLEFHPLASAQGFSNPIWVGLYGNLFSLGRSIFLYSPPTIFALFTFRRFYRRHRAEAILFGSIVVIYLFLYSMYGYWHGWWCWGPRYLVPAIPFLIIPLGYILGSVRNRGIVALVACLGIGVQILGVVINYSYVHWDWLNMQLSPETAYLFLPEISPIPTHLRALLAHRYIDLWVWEVYKQFGGVVFLLTISVPILLLAGSLVLLRNTGVVVCQLLRERVPILVGHWVLKGRSWRQHLAVRERLMLHLPYLSGLALMALLAGLPLFQFKIMSGHDALEYLPRTVEFYEGLRAGQFFPRWAPDLSAGYGQPFFNFNPPLFYYVSAFFHVLGFNFVASQNLACFALLLLAGLGMYLLAGEIFGRRGGLVSAVAYLFSPYLLVTLYVRHALADFSAFALIPLAFWGLYRFAKGGRYPFILIGALSLALLLLSSNTVSLITFPALLLGLGWLAWAGRSWRTLLRGLWCLVLGLGLSAFFWLPALVERDFVHTSRLLEGYLSYGNHFVYLHQLIYSPWGYGLSLPGPGDEMSFAIGPAHLLLAGAALVLIRRIGMATRWGGWWVSFSLILLLLAAFFASNISLFLWEQLPLLQYLEFPWRFLSLVAVSTAFICGFPFLFVAGKSWLARGLMGGIVVGLFLLGFPNARPETFLEVSDADYSPWTLAAGDIAVTTTREYEPIWVRERPKAPAIEPLTLLEGEGRLLGARLSPVHREFRVEITEAARLRVNTFYFPGWTLYIDGAERPIDYNNPQGVMEFSLEPGEYLVQVLFADTTARLWGTRLSLLALLLLLLTPFVPLAPSDGGKDAHPVAVGQDVVKAPGNAVDENDLDLARRDP